MSDEIISVQEKMIKKCESILRSLNVVFYIQKEDGTAIQNGDIQIVKKKAKTRSPSPFPRGTITGMFREAGVDKMNVGDVLRIPNNGLTPFRMKSSLAAYANYRWGKGTSTTASGDGYTEIMRHEPWGEK